MKVFNTLTKEKEEFVPLNPERVTMYHCGPTVYWTQQIGNMRAVVIGDLIYRTLCYLNYEVTFVRNYTDVGHLTGDNIGDADTGEDRMEKAARRENLDPQTIADKYIAEYQRDIQSLNAVHTDPRTGKTTPIHTRATDYIKEMQDMVKTLLEKNYAYTTDLAVYFDITKAKDYTQLSGQDISHLIAGTGHGTVDDTEHKKNPGDFALWFFKAGTHANALQTWPSPFTSPLVENGQGFPGWHIECSAMSISNLGETIDIHLGGIEHIPIHHTNEIAQSEGVTGKQFVRYWLHNQHLLINNSKMSKSEGNVLHVRDIIEKGYNPLVLRYFFLQAHYRSQQNFTWDALDAANNGLQKLYKTFSEFPTTSGNVNESFKKQFSEKIADDLNIPQALAVMHEMLKSDISDADKRATLLDFDHVLGLDFEKNSEVTKEAITIPAEVQTLLDARKQARDEKNWSDSDRLRDEIKNLGFEVKDTDEGQKIEKI